MESDRSLESERGESDGTPPAESPSVIRRVFWNRFDQWRAGWRILVYLILLIVGNLVLAELIRPFASGSDLGMTSWVYSLSLVAFDLMAIGLGVLVLRFFDRRPGALLGVGFGPGWWRELGVGIAAGIVTTGGLTLVLAATGLVSLELSPRLGDALAVMPKYLFLFAAAGTAEELVFRGYLLQALAEGTRRWIAAVLLSLPFAVVHLGNPDVSVVGIVNIFLVGLVIALLYFQTLRLWLPIGFHLSWNFVHGWLWGFDVSGIDLEHHVLTAHSSGPELLTGGEFGLEGSILTTALVVGVGIWLLAKNALAPSQEMEALWAPYPRGFGLAPAGASEELESPEEGSADSTGDSG